MFFGRLIADDNQHADQDEENRYDNPDDRRHRLNRLTKVNRVST